MKREGGIGPPSLRLIDRGKLDRKNGDDFHLMTPLNPSFCKVPVAKLVPSCVSTETRAGEESFRSM